MFGRSSQLGGGKLSYVYYEEEPGPPLRQRRCSPANGRRPRPKRNGIGRETRVRWALGLFLGTRPNGSLGILDNNNAQHSTVGRSCLCSSPRQKGRYLRFILGRPIGRPFSWELFARIPLTNDESISTLFRVGKDSIYLAVVSSIYG